MYLDKDNTWVRRDLVSSAVGDSVVNGKAQFGPHSPQNGILGDARRSTVELGKRASAGTPRRWPGPTTSISRPSPRHWIRWWPSALLQAEQYRGSQPAHECLIYRRLEPRLRPCAWTLLGPSAGRFVVPFSLTNGHEWKGSAETPGSAAGEGVPPPGPHRNLVTPSKRPAAIVAFGQANSGGTRKKQCARGHSSANDARHIINENL